MESLAVNVDFWKGKRVLLTGHTGFKGSWLSMWLQSMGAEVMGYALPPPNTPNLFDEACVSQGMDSVYEDVRDLKQLHHAFSKQQPEIVFHLAAQALVRYSYENPVETYSTNVLGTVNLLEAVRHCGSVKAVVNVTSDKCYENLETMTGYRENDVMGGHDPYSNSKGCAELVTAAYRNSYFNSEKYNINHNVALASARAGNVIGGGDWAEDRLVPDMVRAITEGKSVNIRNPNSIRPWQHVLEPLSGYLVLAQKLFEEGVKYAEAWNFGPNDEDAMPVEWIVDTMVKTWGKGASWQLDVSKHPYEAHYLRLDCSKASQSLDWKPKWSIAEAIDKICDWHKAHDENANMKEVSLNQIKQYQVAQYQT